MTAFFSSISHTLPSDRSEFPRVLVESVTHWLKEPALWR